MKKLATYGISLLLGIFSVSGFAQTDVQNSTTVQTVESAVVNPNVVNINSATAAEIQDKLVGIGAKKAQALIEYREKHGKFISVEQLTEVSGIGKATLDKNRDRIVLE
ncbi:ComEA family DNA-binding protein [Glaesserella sp.]|uniref:ComEA family DNA-binding protein n=1 Tax=Glaesserella sp. TaxID=2094731 RepID=UPI0035A046D4